MTNNATHSAASPKPVHEADRKCLLQGESDWRIFPPDKSKEGNDEEKLHEALARVTMAHNLLILVGSGASIAVGGPSMGDLWNDAKNENLSAACDITGHPITDEDIEKLLSRCHRARDIVLIKEQVATLNTFCESVESNICNRCRSIEAWGPSDVSVKEKLEPFTQLLSRVVPRRNDLPRTKIFTTNYDLCIEFAAKQNRMPVLDGFDLIHPQTFDGRWFDYDFVRREVEQSAPTFLDSVFHLYKLHGSVDWERTSDGIRRNVSTKHPYLIYPRDEKYALSFEQPFSEMMARFQMALRVPDTALLILGFGFNDRHLYESIYNALATNPRFGMTIVDPYCEEKLKPGKGWEFISQLHRAGAAANLVQFSFKDFPAYLPRYSQARESSIASRTSQLLQLLSSRPAV